MDVIGELLRASLLTELGADEDRVARVRGAAEDLAAELVGDSRALVPYAVIASVDESTSATASPLAAAERALFTRWETFANAFPASPTEVLRAVTLGAVVEAAAQDRALRQAAWYALRSVSECLPIGRWASPVADIAAEWDGHVNDNIAAEWSPPAALSVMRMPTIPKVEIDRIPIDTPLRDRATELQNSGHFQHFSQGLMGEFAQHVDSLVGVSEQLAATAHKQSIGQFKEFAAALGTRLRDALAAHDQSMAAVRLRGDLLWWRQTAFSARLARAYADMPAPDVVIAAAVDLHDLVPPVAPLAVEHLLADLVADVSESAKVTIADLAGGSRAGDLPASTEVTPATVADAVRRGTETPLVGPEKALTSSRAAILIFRDLQARRLAATVAVDQPGEAR